MAGGTLIHWRYRRLRVALVDRAAGEALGIDAAALDRHLAECATCREMLETLREIPARLREEPGLPPAHWERQRDAVMAAVRRLSAPAPRIDWRPRLAWGEAAVAAAAAVMIAVVLLREPVTPYEWPRRPATTTVERLDDATLLALADMMAVVPGSDASLVESDGTSALTERDLQGVAALIGDR